MSKISIRYKIIAIFSIVVLTAVQFFLIYNTYTIKSEHFYSNEREIINNDYSRAIVNDKLYPGGSKIIDAIFNKKIDLLGNMYTNDRAKFNTESQSMMENIFTQLKEHNNLNIVLDNIIKKKHHFSQGYKYALIINKFEIAFNKNKYIQIYPYSNGKLGFQIVGGSLQNVSSYNRVTGLTVSSPTDKSYRIQFTLHIENNNRTIVILGKMLPTFLLSLSSILSIIILFMITFNNWIKQKKLAEMQTDFINSISHEFNTPLTAIIIANKSLQNTVLIEQTNQTKNLTGIIQRQTTRLNELFGQVLNLTRTNTSTIHKHKESLNILLSTIVEDYKTKLPEENQKLIFKNELQKEEKFQIDTFWFTTMIQNIIENGFKYNNKEEKLVKVILRSHNKNIQISISDNGIGMSENTTKRIFEKFYRHNNKLTSAGGLGLGLFYVKQCVQIHNWSIKIESKQSEGSTFVITL